MKGTGGMTIPGAGGQVPPRPDQQYPGSSGVVVAPGSPSVVRARLIIVSGTGANSGLFVYAGTPALGNPPIFWSTSASTDPYGNAIPSTAGVAGTGTFRAGNTIINASGIFTYSGTPALGNLIESTTAAIGTDSFGNAYLAGTTLYAGGTFAAQVNAAQVNWYSAPGAGGPWTIGAQITSTVVGGSNISLGATNQTFIGNSGTCIWQDGVQNFILPVGGGPFISGESFHDVSQLSNTTGRVRVKKLPWNAVWCDISVTTTAAQTAYALGSLPDATYYPTTNLALPLGNTNSINSRLFVPTSGGLNIAQGTASSGPTLSGEFMWPTN